MPLPLANISMHSKIKLGRLGGGINDRGRWATSMNMERNKATTGGGSTMAANRIA